MSRTIKVAAIQMDANPAPTTHRLERAEMLVVQAAQHGAHLVVLPELFNTGYGYSDNNFKCAEAPDGLTPTWLKNVAAKHNIHLTGSLMLWDNAEIYNAMLLFAPDGRMWRYNKNYPWSWERGYFRGGHGITIADTDLGDFGMLICWDLGHLELWQQYAGRVDMMVLCSCPPDFGNPVYHFPNGDDVTLDDIDAFGMFAEFKELGQCVFGDMVNDQTAWLQVPAVNTVGTGQIKTAIPNGLISLAGFAPLAPRILKYLPQANQVQAICNLTPGTKVVDAQGQMLTELSQAQGETFCMAEVTLPDEKPVPQKPQPPTPVPKMMYYSSDTFLPMISKPIYRRGVRGVEKKSMGKSDH